MSSFLASNLGMFSGLFGKKEPPAPMSPRVTESQQYLKQHPTLHAKLAAALNACVDAQGRAWPEQFDPLEFIQGALRVTPFLAENMALLGAKEMRLANLLIALDQGHVFAGWPPAGKRDDEKRALFAQLATLDSAYPGGLRAYCTNARKLLEDAKEAKNPLEGWVPEVPLGERVTAGSDQFFALEKAGMEVVGKTGFVLVAGGLGERLGYKGIKIALPVDSISGKSFLQWYAEYILAFQARACKAGKTIPLAIMTSDDTHERTAAFLEANDYFGLARAQVTLMKQEKVPALLNNAAHFSRVPDSFLLETKPHGHGDVHHLLWSYGLASAWSKAGITHVAFFQDTNALTFRAMACMLGVSVKAKLEYNSLTVPRTPGEAVGGIARLRRTADGVTMTVNVEYNQLDPLLRATVSPQGDVADASGHSPYPGNINVLALELAPYLKTLESTGGQMPEFVNPKYRDAERTTFAKPTRIECMMQDYPKLLQPGARVGFTQLDRWLSFSPVKNKAEDASKKAASNGPPESASSGEADMYHACARMLRAAGMTIESGPEEKPLGIPVVLTPHLHISPAFAPTWSELLKKVKGGTISKRSSLVLDGEAIVRGLELDGALVVKPRAGSTVKIDNLREKNAGWELRMLAPEAVVSEEVAMRGYELVKEHTRTLAPADGKESVVSV